VNAAPRGLPIGLFPALKNGISRSRTDKEKTAQPEAARVPKFIGGADEDRTHDLRIANATLSQLSYRPT
jgi:hypothetical protein